jgi:hypothetical protein
LTIRERTLGDTHPSVRTSKERIADLQLQAADDSLDPSSASAPLALDRYRLRSGDQLRLSPAVPLTREPIAPVTREPIAPATRQPIPPPPREATAPAHQATVVLQMPIAEPQATSGAEPRNVDNPSAARPAAGILFLDALESIREEMDRPYTRPALIPSFSGMVDTLTRLFSKRQVVAGTVAVAVVLLSLVVVKGRAWGEFEQSSGVVSPRASQRAAEIPVATASALATPLRESVAVVANDAASRTTSPKVTPKPRADDRAPSRKIDTPEKADKKFSVPTMANSVMSHLDSVVSKAGAGSGEAAFSVQPTAIAFGSRSTFDGAEASTTPTRARLIGELPTPRIPTQVTDVEGDVRVRFTVDAQGQPIMSTFAVVTSPHPLLTAAVRRVIPEMHFEPARTGGADGRAIPDVVETSFRFARGAR